MGEVVVLNLNLTGPQPASLHVHLTIGTEAILDRLTTLEALMSDLSNAVTALIDRINVDVAELQRQLAEKDALLTEAMANDASEAAAIASLTERNDALNTDIADTLARIQAIDPLADFPPVVPPPDEPPVS